MSDIQSDLSLTIQELSNVYEELSLLYRVSEIYTKLSIEGICSMIVDEAITTFGVKTAAVLFIDEKNENLYTVASKGEWDCNRRFAREKNILWDVFQTKKPIAISRIKETDMRGFIPRINSLMASPILGKTKEFGAIVIADKDMNEEFLSNDSKLLMAISNQAGMAIENAFLCSEFEALLVGAIKCLIKALEATSYWTAGHTERVTAYAMGIGRTMELEEEMIEKLKICSLLHDIGKIATPKEILNKDAGLTENEWLEIKKHPEVGAEIVSDLKQFKDVVDGIKYHHEHWDGRRGIFGLKGEEIPLMARILAVADAFDALTSDRPYRPKHSKEDAVKEIVRCSGSQFAPAVVEAFVKWVAH